MLKGDLATMSVEAVLSELAEELATGCLHVSDADGEEARRQPRAEKAEQEDPERERHPRLRAVVCERGIGRHGGLDGEVGCGERERDGRGDPEASAHETPIGPAASRLDPHFCTERSRRLNVPAVGSKLC